MKTLQGKTIFCLPCRTNYVFDSVFFLYKEEISNKLKCHLTHKKSIRKLITASGASREKFEKLKSGTDSRNTQG